MLRLVSEKQNLLSKTSSQPLSMAAVASYFGDVLQHLEQGDLILLMKE
jgi:hypothetical protein